MNFDSGQDHLDEDQRGQEGAHSKEEMQTIPEWPHFLPVDSGHEGVAAYIQRTLEGPPQEEDCHKEPERVQYWYKGGAQGNCEQGQGLDSVPRKAVISPPAELGASHIPKRAGYEDDANLVEAVGCLLSQPG